MRQKIEPEQLERFFANHVPEIALPITLSQFDQGQSNPTYKIVAQDGKRFVLRKKPRQSSNSKATHRVEQEYHIMKALQKTDIPVPWVVMLCEDSSVLGESFYIMEFVEGRIFEDPAMIGVSPEERRALALDTLTRLHRLDIKQLDLPHRKTDSTFYDRQFKTIEHLEKDQAKVADVETGAIVGHIPNFASISQSLRESQPADRVALVHGDFKIDNLIFHPERPEVIAVLDWELSTIGHPLSDIVNLLVPFLDVEPTLGPGFGRGQAEFHPPQLSSLGIPAKAELVKQYAQMTDYDPQRDMAWGGAFNIFRATMITQGIAARYARRQASGIEAERISRQIPAFSQWALKLLESIPRVKDLRASL